MSRDAGKQETESKVGELKKTVEFSREGCSQEDTGHWARLPVIIPDISVSSKMIGCLFSNV